MTRQQAHPAQGWLVEVDMPVFYDGKHAGEPVGWLNQNNDTPASKWASIEKSKVVKAWRLASFQALGAVPAGLHRIHLGVEFRLVEFRHCDPENFEPTFKPIIDALTPQKVIKNKKTPSKPTVHKGRGIIPNDTPTYLERGRPTQGEPLGRNSKLRGKVILHITPLPPEVEAA